MKQKITVYGKQNSERPIPLTVRVEWLADGTIKPLLYWTPDGTCFKIIYHSPAVGLAFLKERGEGLRYEVLGEVIETPEPFSERLHTRTETYLYFADKKFSEKNIIDERYKHAGKEYIPVTLDVFPDGDYELLYFFANGSRYMVEKTICVDNKGSFNIGGIGVWHKVEARLINTDNDNDPDPRQSVVRPASIYRELNKWFVAIANTA